MKLPPPPRAVLLVVIVAAVGIVVVVVVVIIIIKVVVAVAVRPLLLVDGLGEAAGHHIVSICIYLGQYQYCVIHIVKEMQSIQGTLIAYCHAFSQGAGCKLVPKDIATSPFLTRPWPKARGCYSQKNIYETIYI